MITLFINLFYFLKLLLVSFIIVFFGAMLSFLERRILGLLQNRYGPNRVGWCGILQVLADMIKMLFKEDWVPKFSKSCIIFVLAPVIAFLSSLLIIGTIPINRNLFIINLNIGVLFFLMISALSVYSIIFAGWSSNNKYALLGAIRAVAQTISYEIFLGLSLMGVVARAHSFNFFDIVYSQKNLWNVIPQFFGFVNFLIAGLALCHRHPFDFPETEQELADGYHIEYSGMKFGMFFIAQYIFMLVISSLITILFFGGWYGSYLPSIIWFFIKVMFFIFFFILIRASLPRPRYDQILYFGWVICFPLSLLNLIFTALLILIF